MINIYQFSEKVFHLSAKSNFIKLYITTYERFEKFVSFFARRDLRPNKIITNYMKLRFFLIWHTIKSPNLLCTNIRAEGICFVFRSFNYKTCFTFNFV